jgi:hypothetical protein
MGYLDYISHDDFSGDTGALSFADSASLLHDYQKSAITGKREDPNYEYDLFPKKFIYSKNFNGVPSNPRASGLDKLHTESFLTNKVRHIENVFVGSNEMPEEYERAVLPQVASYDSLVSQKKCGCSKCQNTVEHDYLQRSNVNVAIEELQKRNEILTLLLIFIVIYCLVQLFYPAARGYSAISEISTIIAQPSAHPVSASTPVSAHPVSAPTPVSAPEPVSAPTPVSVSAPTSAPVSAPAPVSTS